MNSQDFAALVNGSRNGSSSQSVNNDGNIETDFRSTYKVARTFSKDERPIVGLDVWAQALSKAKFGEIMSIEEYIVRGSKEDAANFCKDIIYYKKKGLSDLKVELEDGGLDTVVDLINEGYESLEYYHQTSTVCAYFPIKKAHGIVKAYLDLSDETIIIKGSEMYRITKPGIEISEDEVVEELLTLETYVDLFKEGLELVEDDVVDDLGRKLLNHAIASLVTWGPFAERKFISPYASEVWVKIISLNWKASDSIEHFKNMFPQQENIPVPDVAVFESIIDNGNLLKNDSYRIPRIGNVSNEHIINTIMSMKTHVSTGLGAKKYLNELTTKVVEKGRSVCKDMAIFDVNANTRFSEPFFDSATPDVQDFYQSGKIREDLPKVIFIGCHVQMKNSQLLTLLDNLTNEGKVVIWIFKYTKMKVNKNGLVFNSLVQANPFYDYMVAVLSGTVSPMSLSDPINQTNFYSPNQEYEGNEAYINCALVFPEEVGQRKFVSGMTSSHRACVYATIIHNAISHIVKLTSRDPSAMFDSYTVIGHEYDILGILNFGMPVSFEAPSLLTDCNHAIYFSNKNKYTPSSEMDFPL